MITGKVFLFAAVLTAVLVVVLYFILQAVARGAI